MTAAGLEALLPLPVAIPIAGGAASPVLARISRRLPLITSVACLSASTLILALMAPDVYRGRILVHFMGHLVPVEGHALGIAFTADPFGLTYALAVAGIGALLLLYTLSELRGLARRELGGYACLFQLLLAALIGSALTGDIINLFVWFEVAALSSYGLTGFFLERPIALEAAFKILMLTTLAGFAIFVGAGLLYANHGALNLGQLHGDLATGVRTADLAALGLLVMGFLTKAGLVPFHGWLADAHTAAPGPVSALFSGLMVNLGIVAVARLALQVFGAHGGRPLLGLLTVFGVMSAVVGAVMALAQDDLKRLLAYDTVSQMGVLAVGIGTGTAAGEAGATYHLISHALFKSLLFLCAGAIVHTTGMTRLSEMGGLARRRPALAAAFVLGAFAIAGVPPLNGYVSLGLIHDGIRDAHEPAVLVLMLLAQVITVAALARAAWLAFFGRPRSDYGPFEKLHPGMLAGLSVLGAGCVAFGVFPEQILHHVAEPAAASLLHPSVYARADMGASLTLPHLSVPFSYFSPSELGLVAGTVAAGLALAWAYIRRPEPPPVTWLRNLHNGSVNDYAAYAVTGGVVTMITLLLR